MQSGGLQERGDRRERLRVVLVDDHAFLRRGLRELLEAEGISVVAEAGSGEEALEVVPAAAPHVVVMDLNMPGMGGLEATRRLGQLAPLARVLVLTIDADAAALTEAVLAGACGYLLKDAAPDDVVAGVRAAAGGGALVSPAVGARLFEQVRQRPPDVAAPEDPLRAKLTEREVEILRLLAEGRDNSEIAAGLLISPHTVKNHISTILAKLQMENRIQAAVYAVRSGLV